MSSSELRAILLGLALATTTALPVAPAPGTAATPTATSVAPTALRLPANTVIELETLDTVNSRLNKPGDFFRLKVAQDVRVEGVVVIPAGTAATGQVVHAAKAGGGGKGGELILAARFLSLPQGEVKLRSGFGATGRARIGASLATAMAVGVFGMLVKGKDLELPAGTPLSARLAADTLFPSPP